MAIRRIDVPTHLKKWWDVSEWCAMTGSGEAQTRDWVRLGLLRRVPHTDRVFIHASEADRFAGVDQTTGHPIMLAEGAA